MANARKTWSTLAPRRRIRSEIARRTRARIEAAVWGRTDMTAETKPAGGEMTTVPAAVTHHLAATATASETITMDETAGTTTA